MKILVTSDWHLDAITAGVTRRAEIERAAWQTLKCAEEQTVDAYIMLGDLTDPDNTRCHAATAFAVGAAMFLARRDITNIWLTGNHDIIESGELAHTMLALKVLGNSRTWVIDEPAHIEGFLALPYTSRAFGYDPMAIVEKWPTRPTAVLGHLMIEGIGVGSETADMPRGRDVFLPIDAIQKKWSGVPMLNGHYHQQQRFNGVDIPGDLCRLTFGEQDNVPGFLIVEVQP